MTDTPSACKRWRGRPGWSPTPNEDDDEAKKKAEEAMADDDDPDKDRGRSTRTPGQTMTRAQIHRAVREKEKLARSGHYGNIGINPNPGPSRNKSGDAGMTVGHMLRSALTGGMHKEGYRELEVLEENHITYDRDHLVVPWDFLAEYGRHAQKIERALPSWEPKEIQAGYGDSWKQHCRDLHRLFTAAKRKPSWTSGSDLGQWASPPR